MRGNLYPIKVVIEPYQNKGVKMKIQLNSFLEYLKSKPHIEAIMIYKAFTYSLNNFDKEVCIGEVNQLNKSDIIAFIAGANIPVGADHERIISLCSVIWELEIKDDYNNWLKQQPV